MAANSIDVPGCLQSTYYSGSPGCVQALGARLIAGRDFNADEYSTDEAHSVIVTKTLAQTMWPGQRAVGKVIYGGSQLTVVGVVDDLLRPQLRSDAMDRLVVLAPELPNRSYIVYLLRSAPQDRQRVLDAAAVALGKAGPMRLIPEEGRQTFADVRQKYFQRDVTMISLLIASSLALLFVTALGIGGLANFWVGQRTRQIGIRRAIGATRMDILRHFQVENFMIVGAGVVLGMILAYGLNQLLMRQYALDRLPLVYLPIGAVLLWVLGQVAVFWPARRAAAVPPAIATRAG
jgi:putative ABC transport system permease protein